MTTTADSLVAWAAEAEAAASIARSVVGTAFLPDSLKVYRDQKRTQLDVDATVAQTTIALLTGQELGFGPMASLRSIVIIPPGSGSPALLTVALRALVQHHGHELWIVESTATRAVVRGARAGSDVVQESVWTLDRAKRMIRGFSNSDSGWQRMPQNQLVARATAEVARWIDSDGLLGLPMLDIEAEDQDADGEGSSVDGGAAGTSPGAASRRRKRATRALPAGSVPSSSAHDGDGGGEQAVPAGPPISGSQRARLWAGMRRLGLTDRDAGLAALTGWVGRAVSSSNDLTAAEAGIALDAIQAEEDRRAARAEADDAHDDAELPNDPPPDDV
jgi:hypothetical protein